MLGLRTPHWRRWATWRGSSYGSDGGFGMPYQQQILGVHTEKQSAFRPHTTVRRRTSGFWATDRSLTVLLILLIGNIFSSPLAEFATWGVFAARTILALAPGWRADLA